jgi:hypothetical protein
MRPRMLFAARGSRPRALLLPIAVLCCSQVMLGMSGTGALFTAGYPDEVTVSAGQIFPAERLSPAFSVSDLSSGTAADASSPVAYANDGRTLTTSAWPASFAGDRFIELRFNQPLPGSVGLSAASFDLSWATSSGTACLYFEGRDQSGALIDVEGESGSPLACTSSASPVGLVTPLPGMTETDVANAARVRLFVASSDAGGTTLDRAVITVTYRGEQFTLYPVDVVDVADGTPALVHWGLSGP